jgi:hypothetical protein
MSSAPEWKWNRWDVRADGMVFWGYGKTHQNGEYWVTWEKAIKLRNNNLLNQSRYRKNNPDKARLRNSKFTRSEKGLAYRRSKKNLAYMREYRKNYTKQRFSSDPMFAMVCRLRVRIGSAIRKQGYSKISKTSKILGCDWNCFMFHLESKFLDGMNWDNRHLWHVDHIIPLASANSEEEIIKLNHYTNLQPLWAVDNLRKGCKSPI